MGPAFYVMAILGCADDAIACREVRMVETRYISADACSLAISTMLEMNSDLSFPTLVAQCRPERERTVTARGRAQG